MYINLNNLNKKRTLETEQGKINWSRKKVFAASKACSNPFRTWGINQTEISSKEKPLVEKVPQSKVQESIDQLNCNHDKISSYNDKAIWNGYSLKILEKSVHYEKKIKIKN